MKIKLILILLLLTAGSFSAQAAEGSPPGDLLSPGLCGEAWKREGRVLNFGRDNLFDHINGEAELYFPYGFRALATATYVNAKNPDAAIVVDLYQMGSRLDAFGIYSNYRRADDQPLNRRIGPRIGTEGFISPSQLMFYQGPFFIRIQATASADLYRDAFTLCGRTLSEKLPPDRERPRVLNAFRIKGIVPGSERYIAQSLLGYEFFRRGMTAAATRGWMQAFLVLGDSPEDARGAFDRYRAYLEGSGGKGIRVTGQAGRRFLSAVDPLYGNVFLTESGSFLIGAAKIKDSARAKKIVQDVQSKLSDLKMDADRVL